MLTMAQAFNEWMRRFIEEPESFSREWQEVAAFVQEVNAGQESSYGDTCAVYLQELMSGERLREQA